MIKQTLIIIAAVLVLPMFGNAADTTLAAVPKMTAAEAAETVLGDGVLVRITDTTPADIRVGDGQTLGGIRIGDGIGWAEGTALTQSLNTGGNSINMGNWTLHTLGGWAAISGGETSVDDRGVYRLSILGNIMMEISSELSLVNIDAFAWVDPYFEITTPLGDVQPAIMFSTNLVSGTWAEITPVAVVTNASTLVFQLDPPTAYGYFRATIPSGSGSIADISATIKQFGQPVALATNTYTKAETDAAIAAATIIDAGVLDLGTNTVIRWRNPTNSAAYVDLWFDFALGQFKQEAGTDD